MPFLNYKTNFVPCGIKSFEKQGTWTRSIPITSIVSVRFAIFTSIYIKAPMPPRMPSMLPPRIGTTFYPGHRRIRCAKSPLITPTSPSESVLDGVLPLRLMTHLGNPTFWTKCTVYEHIEDQLYLSPLTTLDVAVVKSSQSYRTLHQHQYPPL